MLVTTRAMLLLMSMMMFGNDEAGGLSDSGWRLMSIFNGVFDNSKRLQNGTPHDHIYVIIKPVDVPCLYPDPVFYVEMNDNGTIGVRNLMVVTDGQGGDIKLTSLNFTGINVSRPGQFDFNLLLNLTKGDLKGDPTCVAEFEETAFADFFGNWPVCTVTVDGIHPSWGLTFTCDYIRATIPMFINETKDNEPYAIPRIGPTFPLINPPADFVNPCGN